MSASAPPSGSFRCESCKLVQFEGPAGACRRCGAPAPGASAAPFAVESTLPYGEAHDALPTLDAPAYAPAGSARDLEAGGAHFDTGHLELDFPTAPPARRASSATLPPSPNSAPVAVPLPPLPRQPEMSSAVAMFLDRDTGMVRPWLALTLAAICTFTVLAGRVARTVAAEVRAPSEGSVER